MGVSGIVGVSGIALWRLRVKLKCILPSIGYAEGDQTVIAGTPAKSASSVAI